MTALALLSVRAAATSLVSVSPASAMQGTTGLVVTFTLSAVAPLPPSNGIPANSATLGTVSGTALTHTNQFIVTARFDIPAGETPGLKDAQVGFPPSLSYTKTGAFTVVASPLSAGFSVSPTSGVPPLAVTFADTSSGSVSNRIWDFGDQATDTNVQPQHVYGAAGVYSVSLTVSGGGVTSTVTRAGCITIALPASNGAYVVVDTAQSNCYGETSSTMAAPAPGQLFYGQDAQFQGHAPATRTNADGTVSDLVTGLMWVRARGSKVTWDAALSNAAACTVGGYGDWRMPTIKELYSLIRFSGANGQTFTNTAGYLPFIDTNTFDFVYGSGTGSERVIDCQDWSATPYVSTTMNGDATIFGVNFSDGRIKGYPKYDPASLGTTGQTMYVRYVRGNPDYGVNVFVNNGDGTISDRGTRLMWTRDDSGFGMNWSNALAWVQARNAANHLGHSDWRLPNAKELQSIVDYTRSPSTTASPALNPIFNCTGITNEAGAADYPFFWTGTTLLDGTASASGIYLCFGRAMGYMTSWVDVHGAGAQRSDFKSGNPADYPTGRGPQGDAVRIYNYVRLVRDMPATNAWRFAFVGDTHTPLSAIPAEIATAVANDEARLMIVAGDLVESGARASTNSLLSQLTEWRSAMSAVTAAGIPLYVVRGNHEDDVTNHLAIWNAFFSGAYAMPANGPSGESNLTYAFSYSNALFLALDDYADGRIHRVNQSWLDQQLSTNVRPHVFVFGHEPAFKAFHTDCLGDYPADRNAFWASLAAAGVRTYLCGHDHFFNVARIDDGDGDPGNDIYQYIVGTGGSTNWPVSAYAYNGTNAPYTPVNTTNATQTYGYLLAEISGPGTNDLKVTLTWKPRTYDANTRSYTYLAATSAVSYTAVDPLADSVGDGIANGWRRRYFGGSGTTTNALSAASANPDGDAMNNLAEYLADTDPTQAASVLRMTGVVATGADERITWVGGTLAWQALESATSLAGTNVPWTVCASNAPPTPATNAWLQAGAAGSSTRVYRVRAWR